MFGHGLTGLFNACSVDVWHADRTRRSAKSKRYGYMRTMLLKLARYTLFIISKGYIDIVDYYHISYVIRCLEGSMTWLNCKELFTSDTVFTYHEYFPLANERPVPLRFSAKARCLSISILGADVSTAKYEF